MILRNETWLRTTPNRIMEFFQAMESNYTRWHPDHHRFEWAKGRGIGEGVEFEIEEEIDGKSKRKRLVYKRVVNGHHIEFAPTSKLLRVLLPRILFRIIPDGDGCRLVQEVHVRIGPVGAWLNRKEFDKVRRHMREEGENLKTLLEQPA